MTETYKSIYNKTPQNISNLFKLKDRPYNFRGKMFFLIPPSKTTSYGTNSLIFKASLLWKSLPTDSVSVFKKNIEKWLGPLPMNHLSLVYF